MTSPAAASGIVDAPGAVAQFTLRLRAGEEAAWREFHSTYQQRLLRYLLVVTRGDEEAARNGLQCAFIRAVRHIRRFDSEAALWSWLTVLAVSAVRDEHRKHRRYLAFLDRWFAWLSTAPRPALPSDPEARLDQVLADVLRELPDDDRSLVESKYFDEQSVREIAAALRTSEKAVESRLSRLRRRIQDRVTARLRDEPEP